MTEALVLAVSAVLRDLYGWEDSLELQPTRKEFEGDATLVVFPFLKRSRKSPVETANEIGSALLKATPLVQRRSRIPEFSSCLRPVRIPL
jgi:arginyl-tRNA synthetase